MCMLAGAFVGTAHLLTVCARQRVAVDRQFVAQEEAANIAERIGALSFEEMDNKSLGRLGLSPQAQALLPEGQLALACTEVEAADVPHKRIAITISWVTPTGAARDTRLTTWKYPDLGRSRPGNAK